jgi:hypothetical protein
MNGFDCNCKLSYEKALQMKNSGFEFAIRYVGRLKQASLDIDKTEVDNILKAGLKLAIIQHCPWPGWFPDKSLGAEYGKNASEYAHDSGIKAGTSLYLDLEGIKPGAPKQNIIDFCNAWYDEVLAGGYIPGVYVGFDIFLTSYELYHE